MQVEFEPLELNEPEDDPDWYWAPQESPTEMPTNITWNHRIHLHQAMSRKWFEVQ